MKVLILASILSISFQTAQAKTKLCPATTKEILTCVSNRILPMVPFVSLCQNGDNSHSLALDFGSNRLPEVYNAELIESNEQISVHVTEQNTDNIILVVKKSNAKELSAIFGYEILGTRYNSSYKCKI